MKTKETRHRVLSITRLLCTTGLAPKGIHRLRYYFVEETPLAKEQTARTSFASSDLDRREPDLEVSEYIFDRLETYRQTYETWSDTRCGLLFLGQLTVGRARWMDHQTASVADVRDMAVKFECIDELLTRLEPTGYVEGHDRAIATATPEFGGTVVPLRALETGEGDTLDLGMGFEVLRNLLCVREMPVHPKAECLQTLEEQEGVEWSECWPEIAEKLDARLDDVCARSKR